MELDLGMQTFELPGGTLQFNPSDPTLLARFEKLVDNIAQIETDDPVLFDIYAKQVIDGALGAGNDIHTALDGVSLLAVGANGKPVLLNLLEALAPILRKGAEQCAAAI